MKNNFIVKLKYENAWKMITCILYNSNQYIIKYYTKKKKKKKKDLKIN
jgi:hypothetical protein